MPNLVIDGNIRGWGQPGEHGVVWPQDVLAVAELKVVPGFVIDLVRPLLAGEGEEIILGEECRKGIERELSRMQGTALGAQGRIMIEWAADPALLSIPQGIVLGDLSFLVGTRSVEDKAELLDGKYHLEQLAAIVSPELSGVFGEMTGHTLRARCIARSWQLGAADLFRMVTEMKVCLTRAIASHTFTIFSQTVLVLERMLRTWMATSSPAPRLSVSIRSRPSRLPESITGSGRVILKTQDGIEAESPLLSASAALDVVESGDAIGTEAAELPLKIQKLVAAEMSRWRTALAKKRRPLSVSFYIALNELVVDTIRAEYATLNDLFQVASGADGGCQIHVLTTEHVRAFLQPNLSPTTSRIRPIGAGIAGGSGAVSGLLCLSLDAVVATKKTKEAAIYCAMAPGPDSLKAVMQADGLIFASGGATSHVSVIARGAGLPCVMGLRALSIATSLLNVSFGEVELREGDLVTIDGTHGLVYVGRGDIHIPQLQSSPELTRILDDCDRGAKLKVYTNADSPREAEEGFRNGAQGLGLCRIEHLLARPSCLTMLQKCLVSGLGTMGLSEQNFVSEMQHRLWKGTPVGRAVMEDSKMKLQQARSYQVFLAHLAELQEMLTKELVLLLSAVIAKPSIIRFLDAPLGEFLTGDIVEKIVEEDHLENRVAEEICYLLQFGDSMMGLRGIRFGLRLPEFTRMQAAAIDAAAQIVAQRTKREVQIGMMAPLVADPIEVLRFREIVEDATRRTPGAAVAVTIGSMIETPRAVLLIDQIALHADFLSFGSNDLSQFVWAAARDSADLEFLRTVPYFWTDRRPFERFDIQGVGQFMREAIERVRRVSQTISLGLCGEHSVDPEAVRLCSECGINYLSCAPPRVPEARLLAGQATWERGAR